MRHSVSTRITLTVSVCQIRTFSSLLSLRLTFPAVTPPLPLLPLLPLLPSPSLLLKERLYSCITRAAAASSKHLRVHGLLRLQHLQTKTAVMCWPGFYVTWQQVRNQLRNKNTTGGVLRAARCRRSALLLSLPTTFTRL